MPSRKVAKTRKQMTDKPRILVVDDEAQLTRVLLRSLTSKGYDVRIAGDGEFALQTFHDWPPSLVVTDLAMPNMGGARVVSQASGNLRSPHHRPLGPRRREVKGRSARRGS